MRPTFWVVGTLVLLAALAPAWAAEIPRGENAPAGVLIEWEFISDAGPLVSVVSVDGEMSTLDLGSEPSLAVTAKVVNSAEKLVSFRLFEVRHVPGSGDDLRQKEKVDLKPGASYSTALQPRLTLKLKGVREGASAGTAAAEAADPGTSDVVVWEMKTSSQPSIRMKGLAGEMARFETSGRTIGILPNVRAGSVEFRIFDIRKVDSSNDILKQTNKFILSPGREQVGDTSLGLSIRLTKILPRS